MNIAINRQGDVKNAAPVFGVSSVIIHVKLKTVGDRVRVPY